MSWLVFHGNDRRRDEALLGQQDIVITTYHTLATERKKEVQSSPSTAGSLFSTLWHRVVLDEGEPSYELMSQTGLTRLAHIIRNRKTSIAKAAYALPATNRWAISGTPIQNKLTDLASIFEFLRVFPFSERRIFNSEILNPWLGLDPQGYWRLKTLVNFVTLCRTEAVLALPKRLDQIQRLYFSAAEHKIYQSAKLRTVELLDSAMTTSDTTRGTYLNALQWLGVLRLICNHGVMHSEWEILRSTSDTKAASQKWNTSGAQRAFTSMLRAGTAVCVSCSVDFADITYEHAKAETTHSPQAQISECLSLLCGACLLRCSEDGSDLMACAHKPRCLMKSISLTDTATRWQPTMSVPLTSPEKIPTKLKALVTDLLATREEKRWLSQPL